MRKETVTIDSNMQDLAGLKLLRSNPAFIITKFLSSVNNCVAMLLHIADRTFAESRSSVFEEDQGEMLYIIFIFFASMSGVG